MYDAIIVGARCAGSPTGMLLARAGFRVLIVDRATFPSDTLSTHFLHTWGVVRLKRWGLLDRMIATGAPPITQITQDLGIASITNPIVPDDGITETYCPRRTVLDKLLVDAAVEAGAEVREGFTVHDILIEDGAVVGIRGRGADGVEVEERARVVVGADGARSVVARAVQPEEYNCAPGTTCGYYAYWSDVPLDGVEVYMRDQRAVLLFPTNDGQTCIGMEWPRDEFEAFREDIEGNFHKTLEQIPGLAERVRAGTRIERFQGLRDLPNFFRKPYGPGWALVGDAGYYKDPITGTGISDAFRDAELLAEALADGFAGRGPLDEALAGYEQRRNEHAMPIYQQTLFLASLPPVMEIARAMAPAAPTAAD
jgi:flavin-dependent dehydrogenase